MHALLSVDPEKTMQLLSCIFEDTYIFQFVDSMVTPDLCIFMLKLNPYTASFHVYDSSSAYNIVYTLKQILVSRRENTRKKYEESLSPFWNV